MRQRRLWFAGVVAAVAALWLWTRHLTRTFEDRDVLVEAPPGERARIDGVELHYIDRGTGDPLVLIHGLDASTYMWRYNIDALARDHRVVAVDLLGCGYSQRIADADYSLAGHARRVASVMDLLGIADAVIVGHSLGGLVGLRLATDSPGRVRRLILIAPATPSEAHALSAARYFFPLRPIVYALAQNRALRRRALMTLYGHPGRAADEAADQDIKMARMVGHRRAIARLTRALARERYPDPAGVTVPTLIVWGTRDRLIRRSHVDWLVERIPHAYLLLVPGAGHMVPEERPSFTNNVIAAFASTDGPSREESGSDAAL
ncbi:MAG TPA: alpha/beta fold hydrolase [Mycobacterium sp.]|nr:alpha/beta fold hydrolase [Mycobacterium sp.]